MINVLITIGIFLLAIAFSWAITIGIIKLITLCFGISFSLAIATGIWLIIALVSAAFRGRK